MLYQKNIEAHAEDVAAGEGRSVEEIILQEVGLTVLHEFGHYFGLDEEALKNCSASLGGTKRTAARSVVGDVIR